MGGQRVKVDVHGRGQDRGRSSTAFTGYSFGRPPDSLCPLRCPDSMLDVGGERAEFLCRPTVT